MDLMKVLMSGLKFAVITALGILIAALGLATGFVPEGALNITLWNYIVLPIISFVLGALQNLYKHWDDGK